MTRQILKVNEENFHYIIIHDDSKTNPYRVYRTWYNMGKHRKMVAEYADFQSAMWFLAQTSQGV